MPYSSEPYADSHDELKRVKPEQQQVRSRGFVSADKHQESYHATGQAYCAEPYGVDSPDKSAAS